MTTQVSAIRRVVLVGLDNHRHRIPTDDAANTCFELKVAGLCGLQTNGNRVEISGIRRKRNMRT